MFPDTQSYGLVSITPGLIHTEQNRSIQFRKWNSHKATHRDKLLCNVFPLNTLSWKHVWGLPSGWESTCQGRGLGFNPWSGKMPHAVEQLSLWATTAEPELWRPRLQILSPLHCPAPQQEKPLRWEVRTPQLEREQPRLTATRESPRKSSEDPVRPQVNSSVQSLSCVRLFVIPWTEARQASLSITNSWSLTQIHVHWVCDAVKPSHPLSSPSPPAFNLSQH